jgi:hypothetical protein
MLRFGSAARAIGRRLPASVMALAVLGLAACGADEPESARTPQAVERDLTTALTDADAVCDQDSYATSRFVERSSYGVPEYVARIDKLCHASDAREFVARSVKVSGVRVSGDRATATVVATGGANAIGKLTFALVRDGVWKVDRIAALDIDRAKLYAVQRRLARVGDEPTTDAQLGCTLRRLSRLDDRALERALMVADARVLVTDPVLVCVLRPELRKQGLSSAQAGCIIRALRSDDGFVAILLREDEKATEELFAQAAQTCAATSI